MYIDFQLYVPHATLYMHVRRYQYAVEPLSRIATLGPAISGRNREMTACFKEVFMSLPDTWSWNYLIVGGRKLSRIGRKWAFCGENFCGTLNNRIGRYGTPKFCEEKFRGWLTNREIRESVLSRNFPPYTVVIFTR